MFDIGQIETTLQAFFNDIPDVVAVYLFGSIARKEANQNSDVDIGVLLAATPPQTLDMFKLDWADTLERQLNRHVDLVVLNNAPADLLHRVFRDGKILVEKDRSARIRFEVRARNAYFDLQPILNRYRRVNVRKTA